jgi:hypothetical protein
LDRAWVKALACQSVAESGEPLSRQSLADLSRRIQDRIGRPMSRSTICRILHCDALKPWQHESWIFPCDPDFGRKAGRVLDLYAGRWQGRPLHASDAVLSSDEKTSIQARRRRHAETPPRPGQTRRVEHTYDRMGALQYLAAWDVRRGTVVGRCEASTGIAPFGRLLDQVLAVPEYRVARRIFVVVDNGSSHRGAAAGSGAGFADCAGAFAGACELVEPGGGLFFAGATEGADAERLPGFGVVAGAAGVVRGVDESCAEAVCVELHSPKTGRVVKACEAAFFVAARRLSRRPEKPRHQL